MAKNIVPATPGRTEMSHGKGRFPDPKSNFQTQRNLPWVEGEDKRDAMLHHQSELRMDVTSSAESLDEMPYALGNPDMYGPDLPLVQEKVNRPSTLKPRPIIRYGVDRQS